MTNIFLKVKAWQLSLFLLSRAIKHPGNSGVCILNSIVHKVKLRELILYNLDKDENF